MRFGIQLKVAALLVALLAVAFGAATLFTSASLSRALDLYGESSRQALRQASVAQEHLLFSSLETGTRHSIEQGEMAAFQDLLGDLGKVRGVQEIGLAAPEGNILFSNRPPREWRSLPKQPFAAAMRPQAGTEELNEGSSLLLLRAHRYEKACLRCHAEAHEGDLSGVLFARFDLAGLRAAETEGSALLAKARDDSVRNSLLAALLALVLSSLGIYLFLGALVHRPLAQLNARLGQIARGEADLTARLPVQSKDEMGEVALHFNALMENLQGLVRQLRQTSDEVARGSGDIRQASRGVLKSVTEQSASSRGSAAAIEFLSQGIGEVARGARQAAEVTRAAASAADLGRSVIGESLEGMSRTADRVRTLHGAVGVLAERSEAIVQVMDLIDELSEQTRMLSVNASIEAARAGDAAAGFGVVAAEVRRLSESTAHASEQVREALAAIRSGTEEVSASAAEGLREVEKSGEAARQGEKALHEIVSQIEASSTSVAAIAASTERQSMAVKELGTSLDSVAGLSESLAGFVQQTDRSAESLSEQTRRLAELAARFKA